MVVFVSLLDVYEETAELTTKSLMSLNLTSHTESNQPAVVIGVAVLSRYNDTDTAVF